ncbi:DinB family protein [Neobacillus sp. D3-1R]|uniref:DinB family protein n=1 Tax=Neobacillus sp. D3-1R TaxID=3445778 RepID=UPI003FA0450B
MNLQEIRMHYVNYQEWLQSLMNVNDEKWYAPIAENKWSTAAVISHLLSWDKHSLNERFPHFQEGVKQEGYPNFQHVNDTAKEYAHSGITKEQLINEIIEGRQKYFQYIDQFTEEDLRIRFSIGEHSLTVKEYFEDFIGHDLHHQKQIINAIQVS